MTTKDELLADSYVRKFLEVNVNVKPSVERAAEQLMDESDALIALKKVLPALSEKTIHVFFSYKKKDEQAAMKIVNILRELSANKLLIHYQAEFTEEVAGKLWRDRIRQVVRPANWFILLLPDPSDDWDWCLFETGLFVGNRTSADRLICLHHPDTVIPSQIEDYHAVAADPKEMQGFLRMVLTKPDPVPGMSPLNPALEEKIPQIAQEIIYTIKQPRKSTVREIFEPWVALKVNEPKVMTNKDDLDPAKIVSANKAALDLFGFLKKPDTWGKLRSEIAEPDGDDRWRNELFHVIRRIANDRMFTPVQAVFRTKDGMFHQPVVMAIDREGEDEPIDVFHITFNEEISAADRSAMPKQLAMLGELLRFVFRFRWEVLEPFSKGPVSEDDVNSLSKSMDRIKKDWESRNMVDVNELFAVFNEEHRSRFLQMTAAWMEIHNDEGTGKLDVAIDNCETEQIPLLLKEFLPMNQEFLKVAAERFSDMISAGTDNAS